MDSTPGAVVSFKLSLAAASSISIGSPLDVTRGTAVLVADTEGEADVAVSSLAVESRRAMALRDRVVRRSGFFSSATSFRPVSTAGDAPESALECVGEPPSLLKPRVPDNPEVAPEDLGLRGRLAGYVASPSSGSLRFRFPPGPPPRLRRGLAFSLTSDSRAAVTATNEGGWVVAGSSASRTFAAGRRCRLEDRRVGSSNTATGAGKPNAVGSKSGSDNARDPKGWYSGKSGVIIW